MVLSERHYEGLSKEDFTTMTTTETNDMKQHWQDRHRRNFAVGFRLLLFSERCRCLIMAVWILGLTACSLGPGYSHPDIPVPSAWNYQQENAAAVWPSTEWWRAFS
jgi:hypothetical protein